MFTDTMRARRRKVQPRAIGQPGWGTAVSSLSWCVQRSLGPWLCACASRRSCPCGPVAPLTRSTGCGRDSCTRADGSGVNSARLARPRRGHSCDAAAGVARGCAGALLPDPIRALGCAAGAIDGAPAGLAVLLSPAAAAPSPAMEVTAVAPARSLAGTAAAAAATMPAFVRRGEALHVRAPAGCVIDAISCIDGGTGGAVPVPHVSEGGGGCEASFAVGGSGSYAITGVCADGTRRFHRLSLTVDAPCPPPSVAVGGRAASRDACAPLTRGEAIEVLPPAWAEHGGGVGTIVALRAGTPDVPLVLPCSGAELGDGLHMIVVTASLPGKRTDLFVSLLVS